MLKQKLVETSCEKCFHTEPAPMNCGFEARHLVTSHDPQRFELRFLVCQTCWARKHVDDQIAKALLTLNVSQDLVLGAECAEQRHNLEVSYPITNGIVTGSVLLLCPSTGHLSTYNMACHVTKAAYALLNKLFMRVTFT